MIGEAGWNGAGLGRRHLDVGLVEADREEAATYAPCSRGRFMINTAVEHPERRVA